MSRPQEFKGHCPRCLTSKIEVSEAPDTSNDLTTSYSCDNCGEVWGVRRGVIV